jgi:hypothetical protein
MARRHAEDMTSRTTRLLRAVSVGCAAAVALGPLAPPPAAVGTSASGSASTVVSAAPVSSALATALAVGRDVRRRGQCRRGPGEWELEVTSRRRGRLRIDYSVHDVALRKRWSVFVSDNGRRVAAVTRRTGFQGDFEVRTVARNRRGRDRIFATAVNARNGASCTGRLRF